MDLVKAYDSEMEDDSSDIEEIKQIPLTPKPPPEIDVIELSDSEDDIAEKNQASPTPTIPEIDCIDLEDSPQKRPSTVESSVKRPCTEDSSLKEPCTDLENNILEKNSPVNRTCDVPSVQPSTSAKKIDYLNLEGSESDDESASNEKDISSLIDTASVLNEIPCGPEKPTDISIITNTATENVPHAKQTDKQLLSNIINESSSSRNTPDLTQTLDNAENSNSNACDKESSEAFPLENNDTSETLSYMFREDSRILDASQKINLCRIPRQIVQTHNAHTKLITSLSWCIPKFSYLFLSASQDGSIKIWDLYRTNSVQCIKVNSGLNAAEWSLDGGQIVAGGLDKKAFVYDVQTGKHLAQYDIYNIISSIECHPYMEDVFLVGTRNAILGYDIRVDTILPVRAFFSNCEEVLDIAFLDENEFVCSTNIVSHDSADRTIMVWDFGTGAILSNQIYLERFTCPSLKVHPTDSSFIAQTNGNYIAAFSTNRPYKMKDKRYTGHKVAGHGIECDLSPDGKYAVSGDVEGSLYFYNYSTTSSVLVTPKRKVPTNRVKWHPLLSSTLISSTYDGQINIWK